MSGTYRGMSGFGLALGNDEDALDYFMEALDAKLGYPAGGIMRREVNDLIDVPVEVIWFDIYGETLSSDFEGGIEGNHMFLENESMLVFKADRQPDAFEAAYTIESVVEEFRTGIGRYLPDDFDYIRHIGYFNCVNYYK